MNSTCTGCGTCMNVCPVNAIHMEIIKGYYRPIIDKDICIHCRQCENKCPIMYCNSHKFPKCYAAWADDEIRMKSSSGGAFSVLAEYIIRNNGVVFGAEWTEDLFVKHGYIEKIDDIDRLRRSKYVQSDMGLTYREVQSILNSGRSVMFVGTPCQVAGLNLFLGDEEKTNLLLIDFICY